MNQTERERAKISPVQVYCNPGFILWDIHQIKSLIYSHANLLINKYIQAGDYPAGFVEM